MAARIHPHHITKPIIAVLEILKVTFFHFQIKEKTGKYASEL
jgi:hypothetical protein